MMTVPVSAQNPTDRRDQVVLEHLPLVRAIAGRIHETLPVHIDVEDLTHAGIVGLIDAANKFNPEKMVAFSSYAKHRIRGAILDSLRQQDWASRDVRRRHKQAEAAAQELTTVLQRTPTEVEVAERMGLDVERFRQMKIDLQFHGPVSLSGRRNEQEDLGEMELPSKPDTQPDHLIAQQQLRELLAQALHVLPTRHQKVVDLYYTKQMTMKEIGEVLGVNESRVSQIHKSALAKMGSVLTSAGVQRSRDFVH